MSLILLVLKTKCKVLFEKCDLITTFVAAVAVLGAERGIQLLKLITEPVQAGGQGGRAAGVVVAGAGLALSPETGLASHRVTASLALFLQVKAKPRVRVIRELITFKSAHLEHHREQSFSWPESSKTTEMGSSLPWRQSWEMLLSLLLSAM